MAEKSAFAFSSSPQTLENFKKKCVNNDLSMVSVIKSLMKLYLENPDFKERLKLDSCRKKVTSVPLDNKLTAEFRNECKREGYKLNFVMEQLLQFYLDDQVEVVIESKAYLK